MAGRKITCGQPPSLLHRGQQVKTLKNSNFHWSRYEEPLVQPSSLSLHGCVMSTGRNRALNLPYLSNVPTKGCLLLGLRGGSRGLGINEVELWVLCIVYKCTGRSGEEVCVSLPLLVPDLPTAQHLLSHLHTANHSPESWGASSLSHTPGIKAQFPRKANFAEGWRKRHRLIKFPWPPFLTTSFRSEAQRQVPICKAAPGNTWPVAPTQWKRKQAVKKAFKVPTGRMFLSQIPW